MIAPRTRGYLFSLVGKERKGKERVPRGTSKALAMLTFLGNSYLALIL